MPTTSVINEAIDFELFVRGFESLPKENCRRLEFIMPSGVLDDLQRAVYPEFGHYVFRDHGFSLASAALPAPNDRPDTAMTTRWRSSYRLTGRISLSTLARTYTRRFRNRGIDIEVPRCTAFRDL